MPSKFLPEKGDTFSYAGACQLKAKIEKYWIRRGYPSIKANVVKEGDIYVVRSNIGADGLPARSGAMIG